jgi:hypothetical protein
MKFDMKKAWVTWAAIGFGIVIYALFEPQAHSPIGFVWGHMGKGNKTVFTVLGSFVPVWARRQGVRTRINDEILKQADVIRSAHGSPDGAAFMRATGYKFSPEIDLWWKCRPMTKQKKTKRRKT